MLKNILFTMIGYFTFTSSALAIGPAGGGGGGTPEPLTMALIVAGGGAAFGLKRLVSKKR
ncbi:MAG: PEP-CTERM sorting domain-containing protein [Proteobacteria bacterium]|nr:PEP-CTERM sorting domain-containing protein [Pseudomonadota bacterium]